MLAILGSSLERGLLGKLQNWLDIKLVRRFDQFVVLTQEDIPNWDVPNTICIPNGNTFAPVESATLDVKKVISSGRMVYRRISRT